jgi:protein-disulfide isomerase
MKRILLTGAALLFACGAAFGQGFSPEQRSEIIGIIRDAMKADPSILRDAIAAMQQQERTAQESARREALAASADALFRNAADPIKGNPQGDVTIVEFFDARCTYCKALYPTMQTLLQRDRNIRVVLKDLPILGPNSVLASRALMAAQKQGKYEPLYDALLRLRTEPTEATIQAEAQRAGLDWPRLRRDMEDPAIQRRIEANVALAQRLQLEGTPALVIGDTLVPGAVELPELERLVAVARQQQRG